MKTGHPDLVIMVGQSDRWLGLGYFLLASPALLFSRLDDGIALLWLATASPVPRLALVSPRQWLRPILYCSVASIIASAMFGAGFAAAPLFAAALMIEATVGAMLLRRFIPDGRFFDAIPAVGLFVGLIGILMPAVAAFAGAGAASLALDQVEIASQSLLDPSCSIGLAA